MKITLSKSLCMICFCFCFLLKKLKYWASTTYFSIQWNGTVWYWNEIKIWSLQKNLFWLKTCIKGFYKIWHKICHFASTIVNKMKPRGIFMPQKSLFSTSTLPTSRSNKFWMKMYKHWSRIRQNSTESDKKLQLCTESYSCWQNAKVIDNNERKFL